MHIQKNKKADALRIMNEAFRDTDSKSQFFNKEESKNNIYLWSKDKALERLNNNINNNYIKNKNTEGKRAPVIMVSSIITLPPEVKPKDETRFWNLIIKYHNDKLGKENLIYFVVHKDELNTHGHIAYTPTKDGRFKCKDIINKRFLDHYHSDLQNLLEKEFNYHITIERDEKEKELNPHLSWKEYKANKAKERQEQEELKEYGIHI